MALTNRSECDLLEAFVRSNWVECIVPCHLFAQMEPISAGEGEEPRRQAGRTFFPLPNQDNIELDKAASIGANQFALFVEHGPRERVGASNHLALARFVDLFCLDICDTWFPIPEPQRRVLPG